MTNVFTKNRIDRLALILGLVTSWMIWPAAMPEPAEAAFSYNGKIVYRSNFDGDNEIFIMNADGSNQMQLTHNTADDNMPEFSPDGARIAFKSDRDGDNDIYIMDPDGSNVIQVTTNPALDTQPSWAPDGSGLIFTSDRDGNEELYFVNLGTMVESRVTNNAGSDSHGRVSPDGTKVVYGSFNGVRVSMYISNIDGSNRQALTSGAMVEGLPSWSPDGQRIIFIRNHGGGNIDLYSIKPDGTDEIRITNTAFAENHPRYSPDGSRVIYSSNEDGDSELFAMDVGGGNKTQLTVNASSEIYPHWQPMPNKAPAALPDAISTMVNQFAMADVLSNDSDEEALNPANLTVQALPGKGSASVELNKIKYIPNPNYVGADQLTYRICDSFMLNQKCSTAVLTIEVKPLAAIAQVGNKTIENGVSKVVAPTNRPTFSGTATPHSTIKVEIHSDPIILTTTADGDGSWSITPDQDLPPGDHTVYISATLNGVTTELDSFVLAVQQTTPNTGADWLIVRGVGAGLMAIGIAVVYMYRRRLQNLFGDVPKLFPE